MSKPLKFIQLLGPTATGKTDLVFRLSSYLPIEIIGLDSVQVYQSLDIGSAKPTKEMRNKIPHHLIDIVPPDQLFTVGDFVRLAAEKIAAIHKRGNIPVMVGGTMMYAHIFLEGGLAFPKANENIRRKLECLRKKIGDAGIRDRLMQIDPNLFANDQIMPMRRLMRYYEIYMNTGKKPSEIIEKKNSSHAFEAIQIHLQVNNREQLRERIATRFKAMLKDGFIEEVRHILVEYPKSIMMPSMRSIGYQQAVDYLGDNRATFDEFVEKSIIASRQYAKKQLTWLRHWKHPVHLTLSDDLSSEERVVQIMKMIDRRMNY